MSILDETKVAEVSANVNTPAANDTAITEIDTEMVKKYGVTVSPGEKHGNAA